MEYILAPIVQDLNNYVTNPTLTFHLESANLAQKNRWRAEIEEADQNDLAPVVRSSSSFGQGDYNR